MSDLLTAYAWEAAALAALLLALAAFGGFVLGRRG